MRMAASKRRVKKPPLPLEAATLRGILALDPLNMALWRNTRGVYRDRAGNWITYGVGPNGASDTIGFRTIRITPEMVGKRIAQFVALEAKREGEAPSVKQKAFVDNVCAAGGVAGIVYSVQDAAALLGLGGWRKRKVAA